ncbi:MAG: endonuclease/exonuclease/phosphatase family protein [Alphaproteobacteria bacterium]|nr:endonuclease/exonuclease/phosphatase family protein [Alphaproteobacteria bacterium]
MKEGKEPDRVHLFTWNLNFPGGREDTERLKRICRALVGHLGGGTPVIAAFQEVPEAFEQELMAVSNGQLQVVQRLSHHVALVVGGGARPAQGSQVCAIGSPKGGIGRRILVGDFTVEGLGRSIRVIAVHHPSKMELPPGASRGGRMLTCADAVREAWNGVPAVILGDLNANPYEDEVAGRDWLWGLRDRADISRVREGRNAVDLHPPLWNPMWRFLPEAGWPSLKEEAAHHSQPLARGTFHWHDDKASLKWHLLDQILLSADLADQLRTLRILTTLDGSNACLAKPSGIPDKNMYSDHLPVQAAMAFHKE